MRPSTLGLHRPMREPTSLRRIRPLVLRFRSVFLIEIPSLSAIRTRSTKDFARIFRVIWLRYDVIVELRQHGLDAADMLDDAFAQEATHDVPIVSRVGLFQ